MSVLKNNLRRVGSAFLVAAVGVTSGSAACHAQSGSANLHTDPETGIVYRKVVRSVPRQVVDQRIERQEQTVYRPETVKETKPEWRTTYQPVTEMKWRPYVEGRWNPFRAPVVAYRPIPETRWQARSEMVNRTTTKTRWIAEKRTVEVPHSIVRTETEQRVDYEPIARVMPQPKVGRSVNSAVASRLRPLDSGTPIEPLGETPGTTAVVSNTVGRSTSEPPLRSSNQAGMKTNVLLPNSIPGAPLVPGTAGTGVATVPSFSTWR